MSASYPKTFIRIHEYVRKRGTLLQPASQQPRPSNKSYTLPKSKSLTFLYPVIFMTAFAQMLTVDNDKMSILFV
ncbi:hypothetical protein BofuT4_uP100540.1 [Botrytis cinerea T4]|uniref:Uncharacterized protein n=1 Tax=Botryotinia fuckeliana (strain T4) TaxID=999810 RepID=G2YBQ9_BOTF4|nr:hypothetical protein BofuT4_uP100540.1 [Botrytis cinerea T4]